MTKPKKYLRVSAFIEKINTFKKTKTGQRTLRLLKGVFMLGILSYLTYNLYQIGWREVLRNLPMRAEFYVLFFLIHFATPFWEVIIYKQFWKFGFKEGLKTFITKKILNAEVVGYSGEVYLFTWAKKRFNLKNKAAFGPIKDNTILSSIVSNVTIIIILLVYTFTSDLDVLSALHIKKIHLYTVAGILSIIVIGLLFFRNNVFSVDTPTLLKVIGIHELRILVIYGLEILQWAIILPLIPLQIWFLLMVIKIVTSRVPMLPNRDLIFASLGIEVSKLLNLSTAGIAGILLTNSALIKLTNFSLYTIFYVDDAVKKSADNPSAANNLD
ncbi:MAG: hypothetical protein AAF573_10345 [Bacteroidota bacterium]